MAVHTDDEFLSLINENAGIAHKVCRVYFEKDDREDALQEMMFQLWRSYKGFDRRSKFSTWMYSVCLNTALTYRKKWQSGPGSLLSMEHEDIPDHPAEDRERSIGLLLRAISLLSPLNKAIVLLYLEELSYDEIGAITGISRSNVSVRLVRIKRELETILKEKLKFSDHADT